MSRGWQRKAGFATSIVVLAGGFLASGGCSSSSPANDGGGLPDGNVTMDGTVVDTGVDSGKKDTGTGGDSMQTMCPTPKSLKGWMPPAFVPPHAAQNVCTQNQIQSFWDACRGPQATMNTCSTFTNANMACSSCLLTKSTDSSWGPLVSDGGITFINTAGCIALMNDMSCAKADEALLACYEAACDTSCPVSDFFAPDHSQTLDDWRKCQNVAIAGDCQSYGVTRQNACVEDAGTAAAFCDLQQGQTFQDGYFKLAPMFCSGGG